MSKPETTKDAEELATKLNSLVTGHWKDERAPIVEIIQSALTAAEQRGFERGKTVSAEETWETTLHDQLCLVLPLAKKYANGCRTITEANLCDEADDMMKAYEVHIASMPDAQDQRGKADVVPFKEVQEWASLIVRDVPIEQMDLHGRLELRDEIAGALTVSYAEGERVGFERAMMEAKKS